MEDLELRDATIDLLRASISLMNQDLRGLLEEVLSSVSSSLSISFRLNTEDM